jgi:hypothetical protein
LGLGGTAFAYGADVLGGFEFDGDEAGVEFEGVGEFFADLLTKFLEFGAFQDYGGIDICDFIAFSGGKIASVAQEDETVATLPSGIRIGEVHTDIAQGDSAEDRVGNSVREHIGIGVAFKAEVGRDVDTAEDEGASGSDTVYIPPLTHAV